MNDLLRRLSECTALMRQEKAVHCPDVLDLAAIEIRALLARAEAAEGKRDSLQRRLDVEAMANEEAVQAYAALKAERDAATARAEGAERMHATAFDLGVKAQEQRDAAIAERDAVSALSTRFAAVVLGVSPDANTMTAEEIEVFWTETNSLARAALTSAKEAGNG